MCALTDHSVLHLIIISATATMRSMLVICSVLALLLVAPLCTADDSNILLTGDVLATDSALSSSNTDANFIIQDDCNLVLYGAGAGFVSNTHGYGVNCTLTLNDLGQLLIRDAAGATVWTSYFPSAPKKGRYAAVLRPDGQVAVYGPSVWSTPARPSSSKSNVVDDAQLNAIPAVKNMLFSGQTLYNDAQLGTRDYSFVMRSDCNLALVKASAGDLWSTGTKDKGKHCFARLDHTGKLAVEDDKYHTLWYSGKSASKNEGEYVLVLQIHSEAAIYGPIVWSTGNA